MMRSSNSPTTPNIILINCDDLGYGDLGCYGSEANATPVLDQLAREGLRFTDFYMASPVCSPSRGAMMTGCYPPRIGFGTFEGRWVLFPGQPVGLNPEEDTIPRMLKRAGYATKLVGKWHCGDQKPFLPTAHGFDEYFGLPYSNDMGRQKPDDTYPPLPLLRGDRVIEKQPDQTSLTERYVEESVAFIRTNARKPFFLYFAHMYVHIPLYVPDRFRRDSKNGNYGAAVACIDWATGVLLDELKALGIENNTLVIFTSDNGSRVRGEGGSNGALRGTKGTTWEGGQRVPCLMRWPGTIPAGATCSGLASSMDLYPTLASLTGATTPGERTIDGRDIHQLLRSGGAEKSPHEVFFYYFKNDLEAVRDARWKLHQRKDRKELRELYDLQNDPGETRNLYDAHPDVVARLSTLMDECRRELGDEALGIPGQQVRPIGRVDHPDTLTHIDPNDPGTIAMYDLDDRG